MSNQIIENRCPKCKSEFYEVDNSDGEVFDEEVYWTWYCSCSNCNIRWQFSSTYTLSHGQYDKIENEKEE